MNMIDITPIINAVIALAAAGVTVFLIPWIKSKTTDEQRKELLEWVKIGVAAAEQLYKGQGRGEEKKKYVLEFLASMGFTVDEEAINAAIEAAVNQLNGGSYDEETGHIYDEEGDVVDEDTIASFLEGDGKGDDEDE